VTERSECTKLPVPPFAGESAVVRVNGCLIVTDVVPILITDVPDPLVR